MPCDIHMIVWLFPSHSPYPELPSLEHSLWPEMRGLEQQFEARNSIVTTDGDTTRSTPPFLVSNRDLACDPLTSLHCSTQYWLATPPHDERELETDTVSTPSVF